MDVEDSAELDPKPARRAIRSSLRAVEVAIPVKRETLSVDSSVSPSVDLASRDASLYDTPATSVAATPADSDSNQTRSRKKVSASTRAQQLRTSTFSLSTSTRQKRSAATFDTNFSATETADEALAQALQMEEYEGRGAKRQRLSASGRRRILEVPETSDGDDDIFSDQDSLSAREESISRSRPRRVVNKMQSSQTAADRETSLSDLDPLALEMIEDADDSSNEIPYDDSSDDSLSEAQSLPSEMDEDVPVSRRTSGRGARANGGAARRRNRSSATSGGTSLPFRMSRRVRTSHRLIFV